MMRISYFFKTSPKSLHYNLEEWLNEVSRKGAKICKAAKSKLIRVFYLSSLRLGVKYFFLTEPY